MNEYLNKIRKPQINISINHKIIVSIIIICIGLFLGIFQKWLDEVGFNDLPMFFEYLDISNYFGRLSIWILLASIISVYSENSLRAGMNVFLFFISMLAGYYLYCNYILGSLPKSYMMIWIGTSIISFFLAYICWYAKGNGIIAIVISSIILGLLFSQAVLIFQGIHITHILELVTWLAGILVLYRKPKELLIMLILSLIVAIIYQTFIQYFG